MLLKYKKSLFIILGSCLIILFTACSQTTALPTPIATFSVAQINTAAAIIKQATAQAKLNLTATAAAWTNISKTPIKTRTPLPTKTPWPDPWGPPAKIVVSMAESIPCVTWETTGCRWDFKMIFRIKNNIGAKVERIRKCFFNSAGGGPYTTLGGTGWGDILRNIPPYGYYEYSGWVRTKPNSYPDLNGGRVELTYEGHDDNGNPFSGILNAILAAP